MLTHLTFGEGTFKSQVKKRTDLYIITVPYYIIILMSFDHSIIHHYMHNIIVSVFQSTNQVFFLNSNQLEMEVKFKIFYNTIFRKKIF